MPLANRTRAGRRDCGGGAPFCAALCAALCAMRSRKRPCQPKTAKRFFGGPGSQSPSGQAKERTRILPVRRGFSAPGAPRHNMAVLARPAAVAAAFAPGAPAFFLQALHTRGDSLAPSVLFACHALCVRSSVLFWLSVCLFRVGCTRGFLLSLIFYLFLPNFFLSNLFSFVAQAATGIFSLVLSRGFVPGLRAAYLFLPDPCCRNLPAVCFVCAVLFCFGCLFACSALFARAFFSYLSPFPVWLLPLKLLFICRSGRDGPLLSSEKKVDKDSRGARCAGGTRISADRAGRRDCGAPPSNPHSSALRPISPFPALLAGLSGPFGRKPPADKGNARKAKGAKLQLFGRFCALGMRRGFCPAGFLPAAGNRR